MTRQEGPRNVKAATARPDERQCALLLVHLLAAKALESEKEITRARLSELTLQRLFGRKRLSEDFLREVQEWLFPLGWVLFYAGRGYAVIRISTIEGWVRISTKLIKADLSRASRGEFDFDQLERFFEIELFSEDAD